MSVINKMLRDLDKRQHSDSNRPSDAISTDVIDTHSANNEHTEFVKPQLQYRQVMAKPKPYKSFIFVVGLLIVMAWFGMELLQQASSESQGNHSPNPQLITETHHTTATSVNEDKTATKALLQASETKLVDITSAVKQVVDSKQVETDLTDTSQTDKQNVKSVLIAKAVTPSSKQVVETSVDDNGVPKKAAQISTVKTANALTANQAQKMQSPAHSDTASTQLTQTDAIKLITPSISNTTANIHTTSNNQRVNEVVVKPATAKQAKTVTQTANMQVTEVTLSKSQLAQREFKQGVSAENNRNIAQAAGHYLEAIMLQPDFHKARKRLAAAYYLQQNPLTAVRVLESGVTMFPQQSEFYLLMSNYLINIGDYDKALAKLDNIDNASHWARDKWIEQTEIAQQSQRPKLAEQAYRELVRLEPTQGRWWMGLAYALDTQTQYSQAAQAYRSALDNNGLSNAAMQFIENRLEQLGTNR
ncbi:tetratricopeptide repeat protein [Shewanella intestini]|uniref:Tetratricopeptide repeat protein n=1 Tax=Shewanella intestini TaxID=2017544 RepID=A0ABS5I577_9GAMM|nr:MULTISPECIES: tetratricopeptide repeat protein [Shewanella]MBR9729066.1 tetratricopeptide repeat protein [Shewanella intestini]MRG37142.1 tetratricopeptide repeat protein [Shewanella sp. XMDDZSB0408]